MAGIDSPKNDGPEKWKLIAAMVISIFILPYYSSYFQRLSISIYT
jgi:hypothetical protein